MISRRALFSLKQQAEASASKTKTLIPRFSASTYSSTNPNLSLFTSSSLSQRRFSLRHLFSFSSPRVSVASNVIDNGNLVIRGLSTRSVDSSANRPPKETILLDGCDFEHWLVVMEAPDPFLTRDDIIDTYIKTLAQFVGSEEEARKKIYSVSTKHYFAFGALVSEELSYKIKDLPKVRWVLPDSYLDVKNKSYGGEPFIDGQAVPYDPKYHEEWVRNNARANERSRRNDRPRNNDRSRNFERRRENMMNRDMPPPPQPPPAPKPEFQTQGNPNRDMQPPMQNVSIQNNASPPAVQGNDFQGRDMSMPPSSQNWNPQTSVPPPAQNWNSQSGMQPHAQNWNSQNRDMAPPPQQNLNAQTNIRPPPQNWNSQGRDIPPQNLNARTNMPSLPHDRNVHNNMPPQQNWNAQTNIPPPPQNWSSSDRNIPPQQNWNAQPNIPSPPQNRNSQGGDISPSQNWNPQTNIPPPSQNWNSRSRDMPLQQNWNAQSNIPSPPQNWNSQYQDTGTASPTQNWNSQVRDVNMGPPTQSWNPQSRDMNMPPAMPNWNPQSKDIPAIKQSQDFQNRDMRATTQNWDAHSNLNSQSGDPFMGGGFPKQDQVRDLPANMVTGNIRSTDHQSRDVAGNSGINMGNRGNQDMESTPSRDHQTRDPPTEDYEYVANRSF